MQLHAGIFFFFFLHSVKTIQRILSCCYLQVSCSKGTYALSTLPVKAMSFLLTCSLSVSFSICERGMPWCQRWNPGCETEAKARPAAYTVVKAENFTHVNPVWLLVMVWAGTDLVLVHVFIVSMGLAQGMPPGRSSKCSFQKKQIGLWVFLAFRIKPSPAGISGLCAFLPHHTTASAATIYESLAGSPNGPGFLLSPGLCTCCPFWKSFSLMCPPLPYSSMTWLIRVPQCWTEEVPLVNLSSFFPIPSEWVGCLQHSLSSP